MPFEVLEAILKLACPQLEVDTLDMLEGHQIMPVTLSHVCTTWREITVSTPQFWTEISLFVGNFYNSDYPNVNLMSLFLERSRDRPLFVSLSLQRYSMESDPEVHRFLVVLFSNAARWKTGKFDIRFNWINRRSWDALVSIVKSAPLLESLTLKVEHSPDAFSELLPLPILLHSPMLTQLMVSLQHPFRSWDIRNNIPYHQITHLFLEAGEFANWENITTIFNTSPNLVSCFLVGIADTGLPPQLGNPTVLKHLQHLYLQTLRLEDNSLVAKLNCNLTAPSLKTLMLVGGDLWERESYEQFITRSSCYLQEVFIYVSDMERGDILECMRLSPTLRTVNALSYSSDATMWIGFLDRISEWDTVLNEFAICPNLQEIFINHLPDLEGPEPYIHTTEMLKKRLCPPDGSVGTFTTFVISSDEPEGVMDSLQILRGNPWSLKVLQDDFKLETHTLWKRFGGE